MKQAQDGLRRWPSGDWGWRFRLLSADNLIAISRNPRAKALLETAGSPQRADLLAHWKLDESLATDMPPPGKARQLLVEALALAAAAHDLYLICIIHGRLGHLTEMDGEYQESAAHFRAAMDAADGDPYLRAEALQGLGFNRLRASRFDEAIGFYDRALEGANTCGAKAAIANASGNKGWCYFKLGDEERAIQLLSSAASLTQETGDVDGEQVWLEDLGVCYAQRGDFAKATDFQKRAARLALDAGNPEGAALAWTHVADILLSKGELATAQSFNDKALDILRRSGHKKELAYSGLIGAKIEAAGELYALAESDCQAVIRLAKEADVPGVVWEADGTLAAIYHDTGRPGQAESEYRNTIGTIDREWNRLAEESKITFLTNLIQFFQDYVDFLIERGQPEKALEMAESSRARVLNQRLEGLHEVPAGFHLDKLLRAAKAAHTVILSYWLAPHRSSVWVIAAGRVQRFDLPPEKKLTELVRSYVEMVQQGRDPLARNDPVAGRLYDAVLSSVQPLIPPGANVIVVPDGALHELNFDTLVRPGPRPHYWIEDASVSTAPSLRVLTAGLHKRARAPKLLLIGNPVQVSSEFPTLKNAGKEVQLVAGHFPPQGRTLLTGAAAVPACYAKSAPGSFTDIHFTAHATANRESPLNSAIVLSRQGDDFKLYARDVAGVPLSADLVTVSACRSAGSKTYSGEGLMGFAWAFLQAGAHHVIAGLWDVDDAASLPMMDRLYAEMAADRTPAQALRAAKLGLLHSTDRNRLPYFWGTLEVFTREIDAAK